MHQIIKSTMTLIVFLAAGFIGLANAEEYDQAELDKIISATQEAVGLSDLSVVAILYARGIQSYELKDDGWGGAGPLARLFSAENGVIGDEKIGAHYSHIPTPAWEILGGRVIAESAAAIPQQTVNGIEIGADDHAVAWLNVLLQANDFGLLRILRVVTTSGLPPQDIDNYKLGSYIGTGYTTFYVFLK